MNPWTLIRNAVLQAYSRFLFWKWDRDYYAAVDRMRGCVHARTIFVDVGAVYEKCWDCWALRVPTLDEAGLRHGKMEWTPNSAPAHRARQVRR